MSDPAEFLLLVDLTMAGLKPLSRWEAEPPVPLPGGLASATVPRTDRQGGEHHHLVFSRHQALLDLYAEAFAGRDLRVDATGARLEGMLFGYPPCCVEAWIRAPYAPNRLPPDEQALLFHWACPDCALSPLLVRRYRCS